MPSVNAFHSSREGEQPANLQVHHNNSHCEPGKQIKAAGNSIPGTGGYRLCDDCKECNRLGH